MNEEMITETVEETAAAAPETQEAPAAEPTPSMEDMAAELEKSYDAMGDGEHDTDALLAWKRAEELKESKEDITLTINGVVKGGVTVDFDGIRGFIPASRISLEHIDDLNPLLLTDITVRAIEVEKDSNKLIFSARERLKEERANKKRKRVADVEIGSVMKGKVASIKDYGAFIDLDGGLSGLVHISQISHNRIKHPSVVLQEGQEVEVKVIELKDGKLSLSMKALTEAPEKEASDKPRERKPRERRDDASDFKLPKAESIGTNMGDLFKKLNLK